MKKSCIICMILCLLHLCIFQISASPEETTLPETEQTQPEVPPTGVLVEDASVSQGCRTLDAQVPLFASAGEPLSASGAMLFEVTSGTTVYSKQPDERIAPASLVKIMTLLLAVEQGDLNKEILVKSSVLEKLPKDAQVAGIVPGEKLTLEQLLYCMMVGSGNDAAVVIADYLSGSQEAFVAEMNRRAEELGCDHTHYANATGLHDDSQYTSARDMCRLLSVVVQNEQMMTFLGATEYTLPASSLRKEQVLKTNNSLMKAGGALYDSRVTGGRTGTGMDGQCLAAMAEENGLCYVIVILGAQPAYDEATGALIRYGSYEDSRLLLSLGFHNMKVTQVLSTRQILGQYPVLNGRNDVAVGSNQIVTVALPSDVKIEDFRVTYRDSMQELTAPVEQGQVVSAVQLWLGATCVAQAELTARNTVPVAKEILVNTWTSEKSGPDLRMIAVVILVLAAVFLLAAGILSLVRRAQLSVANAHSRRRRRDRRRSR